MGNKEKLASLLEGSGEEFISGSMIAKELGISRAAVWKNIRLLEKDGYRIEAVNNRGYRLADDNDIVSPEALEKALGADRELFAIEVLESVDSTSTYLKNHADERPDRSVAISEFQTGGRGRTGRSFFSPKGTGLYLSILLKQQISFADAGRLTTAAAVSACRAIAACTDSEAKIKWVNDVFVNGKKVCGILTEASVNYETGVPDWIVTGIGFNVYEPVEGFPEELREIAGAVTDRRRKDLRVRLAASFLRYFNEACADLKSPGLYSEYRKRCFILKSRIWVIRGEEKIPAEAADINEDFALLVRYDDGTEEFLSAGEVSIRPGVGNI